MDTTFERTTESWWRRLRPRLMVVYLAIALALLIISGAGHLRLLAEIGQVFGGFFWTIGSDGQVIIVFPLSQLSAFGAFQNSLTSTDYVVAANGQKGPVALAHLYQQAYAGEAISSLPTGPAWHCCDTTSAYSSDVAYCCRNPA